MELYINSAGIISGAGNNMSDNFLVEKPDYKTNFLQADEPDYKEFIPVMQLRRMSKAVRMGVVASKTAMQQAGSKQPDALSIGTAYGCLQDTEKFLDKMIEQDEQMLTPTAFIQSTHNTVGGQIALLAGCNGHNMTYVHRGHSFEHALINTDLYLNEHQGESVLVGGIDEQTPNSLKALQLAGKFATIEHTIDDITNGNQQRAIGGEGAAFFVVTDKPITEKYIRIDALNVFTADEKTAFSKVKQFAEKHIKEDVGLFISGANGSSQYHSLYSSLKNDLFPAAETVLFKQFCGDYPVASSFALGMLYDALNKSRNIAIDNAGNKQVVMVNNFGKYYSCWKLTLPV